MALALNVRNQIMIIIQLEIWYIKYKKVDILQQKNDMLGCYKYFSWHKTLNVISLVSS